ncbi:MAG: hypothetical protein WAO40_02910 [Candidatus Nanopelagicales bacterium]
MTFDQDSWEAAVRRAAVSSNEAELKSLFEVGLKQSGEQVGHEWARILSALDAGAVTG